MICYNKNALLTLKWLLLALILQQTSTQRTNLDVILRDVYRPIRLIALHAVGRSGDEARNVELVRRNSNLQVIHAEDLKKFCDAKNGPGKRSETPPASVHRLRPGDIDIVGAMGDSLTAGNGLMASNLQQVTVENRGVSHTIGGKGNWRQFLTLPNILKEFNSNLYGYSLRDGLASERSSRLNVAELGAMSIDMPYMAKVLVKRMRRDPHVNMTHHWKLVTFFIGSNDICSDLCYYANPEDAIKKHENDMLKAFRYLRDNVPRLMINVIPPPNLMFLTRLKGMPSYCQFTLAFECPCIIGKTKTKKYLQNYEKLIKRWIAKDYEVVYRDEFNTDNFTISVQPFEVFDEFPLNRAGNSESRYFSKDCFHLSQFGQALAANGLWNNMLQAIDEKTAWRPILFEEFRCPTEQRPYIMTRVNSVFKA